MRLRKSGRNMLTILSISVGIFLVMTISSISDMGRWFINNELESMGVDGLSISTFKEDSQDALTPKELDAIRKVRDIQSVMPLVMEYGKCDILMSEEGTVVWGIDAGAKQVISLRALHGRIISKSDVVSQKKVCMLDEKLAKSAYKRTNIVGKTVSLNIGGVTGEYEIIGIVSASSSLLSGFIGNYTPSFVYVPYTTLQKVTNRTSFDQIAVRTVKQADTEAIKISIQNTLKSLTQAGENIFRVDNLSKQRDSLNKILSIVSILLMVIASISLIVAGMGIMMAMLSSVKERKKEIGIKKSVGAKNTAIMLEFFTEAVVLSVTGAVIGIIISIVMTNLSCYFLHISAIINLKAVFLCLICAVAVGGFFGGYPAYNASKLDPVDALKQE